ncbi:MAG TPA: ATP-binding protein [Pyrinomonadaceae bacterium]|jgi:nitrogen fixation/metabolism regulation signal transduction histidine kinase
MKKIRFWTEDEIYAPYPKSKPKDPGLTHERRVILMALVSGLPGTFVSLLLLWTGGYTTKVQLTLTLFIAAVWLGFAFALRERVVRPLQTLSNLLAALREGDYSIRARGADHRDALGEVMIEVNALGETLREQRLGAMEATALLRTVMSKIDVAIFAFDPDERLRLVNRAGERLLAQPAERLLGSSATELGLDDCLRGAPTRTLQITSDEGTGRWGVSRSTFREQGLPHQLLVLSNLSRALREEERQAWKRLVRVLGHELNNSLAPIKSIAGSLESLLVREPRPADWDEDMGRGLAVIAARAEALSRFMEAYSRLARLPQPRFAPLNVSAWIERAVGLETRLNVSVAPGPEITIHADGDQLDQMLINLLHNAVDASLETGGAVRVRWSRNGTHLDVIIEDEGPGLSNTANLFVPFFTTKPAGTGIGLVLSRQIAEAHGGTLTLENRLTGPGCQAHIRLPL